ncbi:BCAM0308 family protein [Herbaspirillum sp. RV1423]|uniref:BCAM0308 family protein n=1 Tax=Herbaspirillum sp. RV1423 TaxID=1443993 RepID=UPI0004B3B4A8|nr:BCAM0308 family protein [Herbaspirillum sp. RV1423]
MTALTHLFYDGSPSMPEMLTLSSIPDYSATPQDMDWDKESLHSHCICRECGAAYDDGEWKWSAPSSVAVEVQCPACRRIDEDMPAGYLIIHGDFDLQQQQELRCLLLRRAAREMAAYPMERIINISEQMDGTIVKTTGLRLARSLGVVLATTYRGSLRLRYKDDERCLRVDWHKWSNRCRIVHKSKTMDGGASSLPRQVSVADA